MEDLPDNSLKAPDEAILKQPLNSAEIPKHQTPQAPPPPKKKPYTNCENKSKASHAEPESPSTLQP